MREFKKDLEYSENPKRNLAYDNLYKRIWKVQRIDYMDYEVHKREQQEGIDKRVVLESGKHVLVEEKTREKNYGDIFLELISNTKTEKKGWLYTCQSDYLFYYVEPTRQTYMLPMDLLRMAWKEHRADWLKLYPVRESLNEGYTSKGICIPVNVLLNAIARQMKKDY